MEKSGISRNNDNIKDHKDSFKINKKALLTGLLLAGLGALAYAYGTTPQSMTPQSNDTCNLSYKPTDMVSNAQSYMQTTTSSNMLSNVQTISSNILLDVQTISLSDVFLNMQSYAQSVGLSLAKPFETFTIVSQSTSSEATNSEATNSEATNSEATNSEATNSKPTNKELNQHIIGINKTTASLRSDSGQFQNLIRDKVFKQCAIKQFNNWDDLVGDTFEIRGRTAKHESYIKEILYNPDGKVSLPQNERPLDQCYKWTDIRKFQYESITSNGITSKVRTYINKGRDMVSSSKEGQELLYRDVLINTCDEQHPNPDCNVPHYIAGQSDHFNQPNTVEPNIKICRTNTNTFRLLSKT
jgi:hypothetical protein